MNKHKKIIKNKMNDYAKLKNFVNETNGSSSKSSSIMSGLNSVTSSINDLFAASNKPAMSRSAGGNLGSTNADDQTDNWFKDADSDPYCPKLVKLKINEIFCCFFFNRTNFDCRR